MELIRLEAGARNDSATSIHSRYLKVPVGVASDKPSGCLISLPPCLMTYHLTHRRPHALITLLLSTLITSASFLTFCPLRLPTYSSLQTIASFPTHPLIHKPFRSSIDYLDREPLTLTRSFDLRPSVLAFDITLKIIQHTVVEIAALTCCGAREVVGVGWAPCFRSVRIVVVHSVLVSQRR